MTLDIGAIAVPALQGFLALALLLVAVLLVRVDRRLAAFKAGNDGIVRTAGELIEAVSKADVALKALKAGELEARHALDAQLADARAMAETLKLLSTTAQAVQRDTADPVRLPWKAADELAPVRETLRSPADSLPRGPRTRGYGTTPDRDWSGLR